jgi:hypothetical protein
LTPQYRNKKKAFQNLVMKKTNFHSNKLSTETFAVQRAYSLRAFPDYKNQGKSQEYLLHMIKRSIITRFRLGDAGLGNRSANSIMEYCAIQETIRKPT